MRTTNMTLHISQLQLREYRAQELDIDLQLIPSETVDTVKVLQKAGYKAWVVGGCVRDMLLGTQPKDFDIATDAIPDQILKLFKRSRTVGRRFTIVHVVYRDERRRLQYLEVSTLRKAPGALNSKGIATDDNNWSSDIRDDVVRRDFTMNALYLDPISGTISDFTDGIADLQSGVLRIIGDPADRFREDPGRILRLVRFHARYGFSVPDREHTAMRECVPLLADIDQARKRAEMEKLLLNGNGLKTMQVLRDFGLQEQIDLIPTWQPNKADAKTQMQELLLQESLSSIDRAVAKGGMGLKMRLLAAVLWPVVRQVVQDNEDGNLREVLEQYLHRNGAKLGVSRRDQEHLAMVWYIQQALVREQMRNNLLNSPRFPDAAWLIGVRQRIADEEVTGIDISGWRNKYSQQRAKRRSMRKKQRRQTRPQRPPNPLGGRGRGRNNNA